ncbi:zinc finger, c2h2 type domain containing protein [Acanthamoeba castellanii str. Neff]|uniref:Zinc finger, c2h2 type domain containing protein n=1 Tax=Acanthamoeba castellanii (strain ATCC 30010 / Neff) TaxID=1257118 RepID=L8GCX6_ACACF|nr:zinc finger, c2h2 type domain containing protein [Acanthamoeba castellanii str. Neff]ELR11015.1 zinc finger, c2h2 type domain containing protein [Acanthamoeba castellanii str. Neff]
MTAGTKRKRKNATPSAPLKKRARVEENEDESEEDCDDGAFVCVFEGCGKSFNREGKLADHLRTHTGERPFVCGFSGCEKRFTRSHHLKRHELSHTGAKPHRCDHPGCDAAFLTAQHLRRHQLQHRKDKPYACGEPGCDARFAKHGQLQRHLCTEHDHAFPYPCPEPGCAKGFLHPSQLRRHIEGAFGRQSELVKHRREAHSAAAMALAGDASAAAEGPATKGEFACNTCGRTFTRKSGLTQHLRIHEADSTQPLFTCEKCGCSYTKKSNLATHMKVVHDGLRTFVCEEPGCGKAFGYKHLLQRHTLAKHSPKEETAKRPSTRKKRKFDVVRDFLGVQAPPLFNPTPYVFDSSALADGDGALASMPPPLRTGPAGADAASSCLPSSSFSTLG